MGFREVTKIHCPCASLIREPVGTANGASGVRGPGATKLADADHRTCKPDPCEGFGAQPVPPEGLTESRMALSVLGINTQQPEGPT